MSEDTFRIECQSVTIRKTHDGQLGIVIHTINNTAEQTTDKNTKLIDFLVDNNLDESGIVQIIRK